MEDTYGVSKSKGFFQDAADSIGRFFSDTFNRENRYPMEVGTDQDYRFQQKVPLGHHYYGWGAGQRMEYNDAYAWGGYKPPEDWYRGQVSIIKPNEWVDTGIWDRREHTDFGKQFDAEHLMLLDINVSTDGAGAARPDSEWYNDGNPTKGMQPNTPPEGMPEEWILRSGDIRSHCAKYPGAGIVLVGGVYKQCCFKGDICQLEYDADRAQASYWQAEDGSRRAPGSGERYYGDGKPTYDVNKMGKGWGAAKDTYAWGGDHLLDTYKEEMKQVPIYNPVTDAGMLVWTAPLGAAAELGAAAAFGGGAAADVIGATTSAAPATVIAADVLGSAGEDIGEVLGGVVGGTGEDIGEAAGALEPPEPVEGGEVPETPEETPPKPEEEAPAKPKPIHQVMGQAVGDVAGAYLPSKTLPTSSATPSITSPHSAELKQPDRYAPVSDDSIKLEGVLIAVVGITAGALILRHYWPGK